MIYGYFKFLLQVVFVVFVPSPIKPDWDIYLISHYVKRIMGTETGNDGEQCLGFGLKEIGWMIRGL